MTQRRGFTMIEIAIVLAIMLVVMGPIYLQEQKMRAAAQHLVERAAAHQEARQMMARIERDLKSTHALALARRGDGYGSNTKDGPRLTCELKDGHLLRNGVPLGHLEVDDFVVWPLEESKALYVTLVVRSGEGRWTVVSRVERP